MSIRRRGLQQGVTVLVDSGFIYAMINRRDPHHERVMGVIANVRTPVVMPIPAATEVAYLLHKYVGVDAMADFVEGLATTRMKLIAPNADDYLRASSLLRHYSDARLDFGDALIVAVAERLNVRTVLTVDHRHFQMVRPRHCLAFALLP